MKEDRQSTNEDVVAGLIRAAGHRQSPPPAVRDRVFEAARLAYGRKLQARRRRTIGWQVAAAIAGAAIVAALVIDRSPGTGAEVATLARVIGTVELRVDDDRAWNPPGAEQVLNAGNRLRTRAGSRAGILLDDDISLRLAESTEVVFESASVVRLRSGKLYVDTGATGAGPAHEGRIEIVTGAATVRDVGTQFEVLYSEARYRLRVREGQVILSRSDDDIAGRAGEQLSIDADGRLATGTIAPDAAEWQWIESVAPAPDIENQPVTTLIAWVGRETGRPIRYADPDIEARARQTTLHGDVRYLAPMRALDVMLATTDLDYDELDDGTILIRLR